MQTKSTTPYQFAIPNIPKIPKKEDFSMLIIFAVIGLALLVWGCYANKTNEDRYSDPGILRGIFGGIIFAVAVIVMCGLINGLYKIDNTYPAKIAYLEENNAEIEAKLLSAIETYQEYESETYANLKPVNEDSDIALLVSLYPELKSDALTISLLETYQENNDAIKSIRLAQIDRPIMAWWLYFGRAPAQ